MRIKKGAYFKENKKLPDGRSNEHLSDRERSATRVKRVHKQERLRRLLLAVAAVLLIAEICFLIYQKSGPLEGKWKMDDVTAYEFNKNGEGAMILPSAKYEFSYNIKDGTVYIDFAYEDAKDAEYQFEVRGDTLTLTGGNATSHGTYVLTKDVER